MSQDEIVKMARQAGLVRTGDKWVEPARWGVTELVHFAALVAAAEREACAKLCDDEARMHEHLDRNGRSRHLDDAAVAKTCAAAIRARGNT